MGNDTLKGIGLLILTSLLLASDMPAAEKQPSPAAPAGGTALAEKIVGQVAGIRNDDLVLIVGSPADLPLLEDIALAVRKSGAHPLITINSGALARRAFNEVSPQYDSQAPLFGLKLADCITAQIFVEIPDMEPALAGVPASRLAAVNNAGTPVAKRLNERGVRRVFLGNGLYPTADRAAMFGMSQTGLRKLYEDALNVDYSQMQAAGAKLKGILSKGKQMRITAPNGTDLTLSIAGRPVSVSDGVISEEKQKQGGAACQVWLPAGEVYLRPVSDSAEGKVVFDHYYAEGKHYRNLVLDIKAGKITAISGESDVSRLKELYAAAGPGKERLAVVDIGINPNIRLSAGSRLSNYVPAGMISIFTGDDVWAGGDLASGFSFGGQIAGATVAVDDGAIVDKGELH